MSELFVVKGGLSIPSSKTLKVGDNTIIDSSSNISLPGSLALTGAATMSSTLGVTGAATLSDALNVSGAATLSDALSVSGAATLSSTLGVTGLATFSGGATIPTGYDLTITDAPAADTDAANKAYVDSKVLGDSGSDFSADNITASTIVTDSLTANSADIQLLTVGEISSDADSNLIVKADKDFHFYMDADNDGSHSFTWFDGASAQVADLDESGNLVLSGNVTGVNGDLSGTLEVDGESTLASAKISDLTAGRVVLAGTDGAIEDSGNLTFDGSALAVTGSADVSGNLDAGNTDIDGTLDVSGAVNLAASGSETNIRGTLSVDESATFDSSVTISGNLTVSGTTTTVNTEEILLADNQIVLNSNATGSATQDGGIEIERGDDANKKFIWDESEDKWSVGSETMVAGTFEGNLTATSATITNSTITSLTATSADINGGTIDGSTIATSDITVGSGKTLDVSSGTLTLADDQISGDKVEGGTIASITITSLAATSADIDGGTIDGATIATSDVTVGSGKTLDVSGGTLTTSAAQKEAILEGLDADMDPDFGDNVITAESFVSDVATGTAPFVVSSTTRVANLNASLLDGMTTIDEDDMASDSATALPTQQSVKAYVDSQVSSNNQWTLSDGTNSTVVDASDTLTVSGTSNEVEVAVTADGDAFQIGLPDDVTIGNDLTVTGDSSAVNGSYSGTLGVTGVATFTAQSVHSGGIDCNGDLVMEGNSITGSADEMIISADGDEVSASGSASNSLSLNASGGIFTDDAVDMDSTLNVEGAVTFQSTLDAGATTLDSLDNSSGGITNAGSIAGATTINSSGAATLDSGGSGSSFGGALTVSGNADLNGELDVAGTVALGASGGSADTTVRGDLSVGEDLTVTGNLIVNGTTTTVNSTTLTVDDKNIELAAGDSPSDAAADGGGITLKGDSDHTFNWSNANDAWTSSEHMDVASGKEYRINNTVIAGSNAFYTTEGAMSSSSASVTSTTETELVSFLTSYYKSGKVVLSMNDGTNYTSKEVLVVTDGSSAAHTEYGVVSVGSEVDCVITVGISGGSVKVYGAKANGANSDVTVKATFTLTK